MANKNKGLTITGRLKESGITVYVRSGKSVARTAMSMLPKQLKQMTEELANPQRL